MWVPVGLNPGLQAMEWLDNNQLAEVDELEDKRGEMERTITPVMTRIHQQGSSGGMGGEGGMGGGLGGGGMGVGGGMGGIEEDAPHTPDMNGHGGGGGGEYGGVGPSPKIQEVD